MHDFYLYCELIYRGVVQEGQPYPFSQLYCIRVSIRITKQTNIIHLAVSLQDASRKTQNDTGYANF